MISGDIVLYIGVAQTEDGVWQADVRLVDGAMRSTFYSSRISEGDGVGGSSSGPWKCAHTLVHERASLRKLKLARYNDDSWHFDSLLHTEMIMNQKPSSYEIMHF